MEQVHIMTKRGRKTERMKQIERRFGKPIEVLFPELFSLFGNTASVAQALGISRGKVYDWAIVLGYEVESRARLVPIQMPQGLQAQLVTVEESELAEERER